jgi:predicted transcriptional regulator
LYKRKKRDRKLYNEKAGIANLVTHFKNNNEEYLKIKQTAEEKVKDVLNDGKLLLKIATLSVIESLRTNPELCNFMMYYNSNNTATISYGSNYPSFMSGGQRQ